MNIPKNVANEAKIGILLSKNGFLGGTATGHSRAVQLSKSSTISIDTIIVMRNWFARHGPSASNGGTSYPGYRRWISNGKPMKPSEKYSKGEYRGAVAYLIWGGESARRWINSDSIQKALLKVDPRRNWKV